jgi:membrane protease YdiL (CAAX protease family)
MVIKKVIILIVFYILYQIAGAILGASLYTLYALVTRQFVESKIMTDAMPLMLVLSNALMLYHLYRKGYLSSEKTGWARAGTAFVGLTLLAYVGLMGFMDAVVYLLPDLADNLATDFTVLSRQWLGVFGIAFLGPVVEEFFFRVAITGLLLRRFRPWIAIVVSAIIFGVAHWNPAQSVNAFVLGLLLAWMYYRTGSITPCVVLHLVNNFIAWISIRIADAPAESGELISESLGVSEVWEVAFIGGGTLLLAYAIWRMNALSLGKPAHTCASASPLPADHCSASATDAPEDQSAQ